MEDGLRGDVSGIAPSVTRGEAGVSEPEMRPIFITQRVQTRQGIRYRMSKVKCMLCSPNPHCVTRHGVKINV